MRKRFILFFGLVAATILAFLLNFTTPSEVGPFGVLVFFLAFYVVLFSVATGVMLIFEKMTRKRNGWGIKTYLYAAVISFGPILLLLMGAFEVLNIVTVGLAILFVVLSCFLVKNRFSVVK